MTSNTSARVGATILFALLAVGSVLISFGRPAEAVTIAPLPTIGVPTPIIVATPAASLSAPATGTLDVITLIDGGSATSSQVTFHVLTSAGADVAGSPQVGSASGTLYILAPGNYALIQASPIPGYVSSYSGNCSFGGIVAISAGTSQTCTITETAISGTGIAPADSDVSLINSVTKPVASNGDIIVYSLIVTNAGPSAATGVTVSDVIPNGLSYISDDASSTHTTYATSTGIWTIGTLKSGGTIALDIAANVQSASAGLIISNPAHVASTSTDPIVANNAATSSIVIAPAAVQQAVTLTQSSSLQATATPASTSSAAPVVVTQSQSVCTAFLTGYIKPGAQNDPLEVAKLQLFLKTYEGADVLINGVYDAKTIAATEAFQSKFKDDILTPWGVDAPTGNVYLTTRRMVNEVNCKFSQTFPLSASDLATVTASHSTKYSSATNRQADAAASNGSTAESAIGSDLLTIVTSDAAATTSVVNSFFDSIGGFFGGLFHRQ